MKVVKEEEKNGFFFRLYKEKDEVGSCCARREGEAWALEGLQIDPRWQGKGYGSYLLRQVLDEVTGRG